MSVGNELDANVLGWVKSEIDETLGQARSALEVYVDNPDDESQLRFCLNYLHQVHGTLQMVELYGASLAAEEMECLTEALVENKVSNRNDAYEVLIRGILQLPDYLEQLLNGQPDMPMVLLPLLNDLRAARGESLLSENAMFTPDLSVEAPSTDEVDDDDENSLAQKLGLPGEEISELAKKLRHHYHLGLLGWFRDKNSDASLKRIADVINKLRHATDDKEVSRLLWTASGLVESLRLGGLDPSVSVKLLLGQLDRQIKKIIDEGVYLFSENPPAELLKNILYYVATSNADGELTQQIKQAFGLEHALPDTQQIEQARTDLQGPNVALMDTVSSVLMEDLTRVKDSLDVFARAEEPDLSDLSSLCETLNQMSDTLGMLGLGLQRRTIQEQIEILGAMVKGERVVDEVTLMDVAAAMLSIENSLQEMSTARAINESIDTDTEKSATEQLHGAEQHKLMQTVIDEVKIDLARIKEAISDYSRNTMSPELVSEVPDILAQIKGSLSILSLQRAADLLEQCAGYVHQNILQASTTPEHSQLENLADSISSIEYYLESLAGDWGHPETILDVAEQSLAQLLSAADGPTEQVSEKNDSVVIGLPVADKEGTVDDVVAPVIPEASSTTLTDFSMLDLDDPSMEISSASISSDEDTFTDLSLGDLTEPSLQIEQEQQTDATVDFEAEAGLMFDGFDESPDELDISIESGLTPVAEQGANDGDESSGSIQMEDLDNLISLDDFEIEKTLATPESIVAQTHEVSDEIDDEIIEIFMEEAEEEYANIQRLLSIWESSPVNEEPLIDMRRSFHTLKGSGRLVGAVDLGEFAWAFENMLNRIIDHTINTSPNLFEVLHRGCDTLPVLFELFKTHTKPGQNVLTLMSYADALSKGEELVLEEPEKEPVILEPEESNIDEELPGPVDIDPVLLDIYRKEAETHITTLNDYISDWKSGAEQTATYTLLRALHTLNGSSRTAGVQSLSELCGEFENYVKGIEGQHFNEHALGVLEQLSGFVKQTVSILDMPGVELADNSALLLDIIALKEQQIETGDISIEDGEFTIEVDEPSIESEIELHIVDDADEQSVDEALTQDVVASTEAITEQAVEDFGPDYDEELLEIFIDEGEEILDECDHTIVQWMETPDDSKLVEALQRQLHTLKGGARMAGITGMGNLGHVIESMLTAVVDGHLTVSKEMQTLLQSAQDRLVAMLEQVKDHKQPAAANDLIAEVNKIIGGPTLEEIEELEHPSGEFPIVIDISDAEDNIQVELSDEAELTELAAFKTDNVVALETTSDLPVEQKVSVPAEETDDGSRDRRQGGRIQHEQIRVRSDLLDNLVNFAGEVSIYRSRMEQQTNTFRFNLQELDETIDRFRGQLRQFEIETETQIQYRKEDTIAQGYDDFDPLEMDRFTQMQHLSRGMLESLGDLDSLRDILSSITRESETLLVQQSRVTSELQQGLMQTRMVKVSGQAPRLRRIIRQVSDEMDKLVEFHLHGMDNELDRTILDRVIPPIEHMLRNAIAHGIEKPEQRKQAGKLESGNINISFEREGGEFVIRISDDGMGINLNAIRRKAIEKGMLTADAKPSKEALLELMMQSGFSTAEEITQIAGRGVGMDVVNTEIKLLGGRLEISTLEGKGTVFTIYMPLTLSVTRALMVAVGEETYAIPLLSVEGVERVSSDELVEIAQSDEPVYEWVGNDYKYMHLSSIMGMPEAIVFDENRSVPVLLVRSSGYRAAIQIDRLIGSREIVVKPVGPQLSTMRGVSGATIMGDGSVVLIIDPAMLVRLLATEKDIQPVIEIIAEETIEEQSIPTVMIVDDSITVRKVTTRFLERNEMEVTTAKDGVDALGQLQIEENKPDVILLDVEMPRMDGFELATNIRNDERLKDIPIIMITSRTGAKHRDRAVNIGVNVYMGKPYNEAELLEHIHNLTGK